MSFLLKLKQLPPRSQHFQGRTASCCSAYTGNSVGKCLLTLAAVLGLQESLEDVKSLQVSLEGFEPTIVFLARVLLCNHTLLYQETEDAALSLTKGLVWKNFFLCF